jgi:hypothetical protein
MRMRPGLKAWVSNLPVLVEGALVNINEGARIPCQALARWVMIQHQLMSKSNRFDFPS